MNRASFCVSVAFATVLLACLTSKSSLARAAITEFSTLRNQDNAISAEIQVVCNSDSILVRMHTNKPFNGMVYPKGLFSGSSCISEFFAAKNMTYKLPLRSCNTLSTELDDGVEYFNTIVVQPHNRLLTNQGKGYHIRCKYQTRERTITNTQFNVSSSFSIQNNAASATPILASATMPTCTMKIFKINNKLQTTASPNNNSSGGNSSSSSSSGPVSSSSTDSFVKVGDQLVMFIEIDLQEMYGMRVTNCVVRDGLNLAEQALIDDKGCPVDEEILPKFEYNANYTRAAVKFPAHKFPHTPSIYYQCNVRLCIQIGGCEIPVCSANTSGATNRLTTTSTSISPTVSTSQLVSNSALPVAAAATGTGSVLTTRSKRYANHIASTEHTLTSPQHPPPLPEPAKLLRRQQTPPDSIHSPAQPQMSFDVYSGLYVNDQQSENENQLDSKRKQTFAHSKDDNPSSSAPSDASNMDNTDGSYDGMANTLFAKGRSDEQNPWLCLSRGQVAFGVLLAVICGIGVIGLFACQVSADSDESALSSLAHGSVSCGCRAGLSPSSILTGHTNYLMPQKKRSDIISSKRIQQHQPSLDANNASEMYCRQS